MAQGISLLFRTSKNCKQTVSIFISKRNVRQHWQRYYPIGLLPHKEERTMSNKNMFWISAVMVLLIVGIGGVVSVTPQYGDILTATGSGIVQHIDPTGSLLKTLTTGNSGDTTDVTAGAGDNALADGTIVLKNDTGAADASGDTAADSSYSPGSLPPGTDTVSNVNPAGWTQTGQEDGFSTSPVAAEQHIDGAGSDNMQGFIIIVPEFPTLFIAVITIVGLLLLVQMKRIQ
jgi:hypothetical protein